MLYDLFVAGSLYALWVLLPLVPSAFIYLVFPKNSIAEGGLLAPFSVRTVGAVAVYLLVFAATGYPLVQTAGETARYLRKPAPQARDANQPASVSLETIIQRASDYAKTGKYDLAIKEYDKAIEIDGNDPTHFNDRGALYEVLGGYDQAIENYDKAIGLNPNYALAFSNRCSARYKKNDYQSAIDDCNRAIQFDQSHVSAYIIRGDALRHLQKNADAINDYNQAIKLDSSSAAAIFGRALAYDAQRNYNASIADYTRLLKLGEDKTTAFNNRCWARAIIGELDLALPDCNESLRFDPHDPDVLDSRGLVNLKIGIRDNSIESLDHSIADYSGALEHRPESATSLFGRGLAKTRKGDEENGRSDIASATRIRPNIADDFISYGVK